MVKEDGKLGRLLALLDGAALERLRIYLESPTFNRSKPVRALYEHYVQTMRADGDLQEDAALFALIFPDEAYDPTKLKNLRAALQRKLDDFLAYESFSQDEALQHWLQLRQLNVLNESHYFPKYHQKALERMQQQPIEEEQRQLGLTHLAEELETAQTRLDDRSQGDTHVSAYHHAWQYFQLHTIKFLVRQANRGAIVGQSADTAHAEILLQLMQVGDDALPALQLYNCLLGVFRDVEDKTRFQALRDLLHRLGPQLAAADASDIYTGAINHCIRRINTGDAAFATDMLALYQEMDALDLLLLHGRLPAAQFKNMVGLALRFRAFEWAQLVIDRYGSRLDQDPHGNAAAFNQGMLDFARNSFDTAERCFNQVLQGFEDVFYGLDARSYLLRIHYETGNWLGLESLAESFKMYLKRNKRIPKAHRESYLRTALFFGKLAKFSDWNHKGLAKLRKEILETAFAATSKQWLLQKIDAQLAGGAASQ